MCHDIRAARIGLLLVVSLVSNLAQAQFHDPRALADDSLTATEPLAPRLDGLGDIEFVVSTSSADSQFFFNQGLRLTYGFNHSEALRAFKESARLDPDNAMAWWGQALVLGPNINLPMMPYVAGQTWDAMQRAVELRGATEIERNLINALALRYAPPDVEPDGPALSAAYADAMRALAEKYAGNPDVATLTASAIMNLAPWDYWYGDGTPYPRTVQVMALLEAALANNPTHTGALHYYIHIVEAQQPRKGEAAADQLRGLAPGAGHLVHMPSHIYMRLGRYADAYAVNELAAAADSAYIASCQAQGLYPVGYYPHNMHFLVWSAQSMGRYNDAMDAARQISDKIPEFVGDIGDVRPTGTGSDAWQLFEIFLSQPMYTMVRFGDWEMVLAEAKPPRQARFMTGVWHYGRGLAFAHTDNQEEAIKELRALQNILDEPGIGLYPASLNGAGKLLQIAAAILAGEIAAANNDYDAAIGLLELAVRLQDGLLYMEPPDWFMPARHYLGAVLLESGAPAEAETVYWAELRHNPNNGFALYGLWQSQQAQEKAEAAADTRQRFDSAWDQADRELVSSRF